MESASDAPSVLDGVPFSQPALALAAQLRRRAARADVPAGLPPGSPAGANVSGDDLGGQLLRLVAASREAGLDPELELRAAARRYRDLVRDWEQSRRQ